MPETYEQRIERIARAIAEQYDPKVAELWEENGSHRSIRVERDLCRRLARAADAISFAAGQAEADKFVTREQLAQDAMEIGRSEGFAAAVAKLREEADAEEKECGIATDYVRHLRAGALVLERTISNGE